MASPSLKQISLSELHFDPENPRLPFRLQHADEEDVFEFLLLECNLIELMLSIGQQGFFAGEPLLVTPRVGGGYTVVEGNRRLGASKLLYDAITPAVMPNQVQQARETASHRPNKLPALVFAKRDEILSYLGYRHITGIKEWDALAKARYLKQLRLRYDQSDPEAHRKLAREIGSKAPSVAKLLTGLRLVESARDSGLLRRLNLREDDIPFSLLTTGIGYENICKFIGLEGPSDVDAANLHSTEFEEFFTWVFDRAHGSKTVLGESRNLDKLAKIVGSDRALASFRQSQNLEQAYIYTSGPLEVLRKFLSDAERSITGAQEATGMADGINELDLSQADRLRKISQGLHATIKSLVESPPIDD
jgi:hypothetical protein